MSQPIFADDGSPIDATCSLQAAPNGWHVFVESRSGTLGDKDARNSQYALGFSTVLHRLGAINATLEDALVESHKLLREGVSEVDRRLNGETCLYPIVLTPENTPAVEAQLRRAQRDVGTTRTHGGGNTTRRVRLQIRLAAEHMLPIAFTDYVTGARALGIIPNSAIEDVAEEIDHRKGFDPDGISDARQRVLREIALRQGQPEFRRKLLQAYSERCSVSTCDAVEALEAAHIIPYTGTHTHHVQNGLLLRADLHTLFDRGLIGIDPNHWSVVIHPALKNTAYSGLEGCPFSRPAQRPNWPHAEALNEHMRAAGLSKRS